MTPPGGSLFERAVESHRRRADPYREPWPREDEERAVLTCEEMRRSAGPVHAIIFVLAAWVIAWVIVGR